MEILILPLLVLIFVILVIVLFSRLTTYKKKAEESWQTYEILQKKQLDSKDHSVVANLENARLDYNKKATAYNRLIEKFPTSFMASMSGYLHRDLI